MVVCLSVKCIIFISAAKVNHTVASCDKLLTPLASSNQIKQLDDIKTPGLFSAARNALYTRYTHADWDKHKRSISADQVCHGYNVIF